MKRNQVAQAVIRITDQSETELSQDEIDKIYETLHPYTQVSDAVKAAHIERIRQQHDDLREKAPDETPDHSHNTQKRICPRCGAELRVRTARRGDNRGKDSGVVLSIRSVDTRKKSNENALAIYQGKSMYKTPQNTTYCYSV